jgi:nicotinamidase-related amidase
MRDETGEIGETVETTRTALVLIDLQVRLVGQQLAPYGGADVVRQSMRLAEAVRNGGGLIVVVRREEPGKGTQPPGSELVDEIAPRAGDLLITKRAWSAFHGTGLHDRLARVGITTLVLAGIATDFGVESTARDAHHHGYRIFHVADAMAGVDAESHAFAVDKVFPLLGTVCSTDDMLVRLG